MSKKKRKKNNRPASAAETKKLMEAIFVSEDEEETPLEASAGEQAEESEKETEPVSEEATEEEAVAEESVVEPPAEPEDENVDTEALGSDAEKKEAERPEDEASEGEASEGEESEGEESKEEPTAPAEGEADEEPTPKKRKTVLTVPRRDGAAYTRGAESVLSLSADLFVAVIPLLVWGMYLYGWRPLTFAVLAAATAALLNAACYWLPGRRPFFSADAVLMSLLVSLALPPAAPLWLPVVAAAIVTLPFVLVPRRLLRNILHPVALTLVILLLLLPAPMSAFAERGQRLPAFSMTVDSYEAAEESILDTVLTGVLPETSLGASFLGLRSGAVGEVSALLILAAALYLWKRKVLRMTLPFCFLLTVAILTYLFPTLAVSSDVLALRYVGYHLLGTDLLFGVVFLAADPATSPRSLRAAILCGMIGGAVTVGMRYYLDPRFAVLLAVLVINLLAAPLDILLRPSVFGGRRKKKKTSPQTNTPASIA